MSKVFVRVSVDFVLPIEDEEKIPSKYISLKSSEGKELSSGELYTIGYEDEDGNECEEDGTLLE